MGPVRTGQAGVVATMSAKTRLMDFCSEVLAMFLGLPRPWHTSPGDLWDWAVQQPGARAVPEDELRNAWRA